MWGGKKISKSFLFKNYLKKKNVYYPFRKSHGKYGEPSTKNMLS